MAKIGRNEPCPCRSGKKYKRCCGKNPQVQPKEMSPEEQMKVTLMSAVENVLVAAEAKTVSRNELGVFFLYSTGNGDAWLVEMTELDCVQLVKDGKRLPSQINENSETIEINWSHTFVIQNKEMLITAYTDKQVTTLADAPSKEINAAVRRIRKKFSTSELESVHLDPNDM
ncbi:MAG: SEC-C metal-binding domain-containing protein [Desulfotalea sp.]